MDGLVYLLNQSGLALAQANERITELTKLLESATSGKGKVDADVTEEI